MLVWYIVTLPLIVNLAFHAFKPYIYFCFLFMHADDVFLLSFLRGKHISQLEAREALERFMIHRDKMAIWSKGLDTEADEINDIIDSSSLLLDFIETE